MLHGAVTADLQGYNSGSCVCKGGVGGQGPLSAATVAACHSWNLLVTVKGPGAGGLAKVPVESCKTKTYI